jgi:pilus assembly protein Flp/PilA
MRTALGQHVRGTLMKDVMVSFIKEEQGLTMVEYAIAGALVAAGAVLAFTNLGTAIATRIAALSTAITG